jgi:AcrR family transcriptional regulator
MGIRQETRARIEADIVELGRRQLATVGAASLSVRAIARDLGMASSAIYRYVSSRDDLLTLLLVDAYDELADTVTGAAMGVDGWRDRITAMARAARGWAVRHPARWALLYGSPVPGYTAPPAATVVPGTRVIAQMLAAAAEGASAAEVGTADIAVSPTLAADFGRIRAEFTFAGSDSVLARCLGVWATLIGAISLEVFGQYGSDTFTDSEAVFDTTMELALRSLAG